MPEPGPCPGIDWVPADVLAHLETVPPGSYDAVTLSNVLDGAAPAYVARLRAALERAVRPGGVAVLRSFAARPPLPGTPLPDRSLLWGSVTSVHIGG
jgi:hypothetical protein